MINKITLAITAFATAFTASAAISSSPKPPEPSDNPTTPAKIELGRLLYHDPRLSKDNSISCNSCHDVNRGGVDGQAFSKGVGGQLGGRNSPSVINAAFHSVQFWDGRAATLEDQAKGPLVNPKEMAMPNHAEVEARVKGIKGYAPYFEKAFGNANSINIDNIARAIAAYERTLVTFNSPYDRFMAGDKRALKSNEKKGMELFQSIGCTSCHSGPHFSGARQTLGEGNFMKFPLIDGSEFDKKYRFSDDKGRWQVTQKDEDRSLFRVPSLRNVAKTAPYFHNGAVSSLTEAVKIMAKTQLGRDLNDKDSQLIAAFLGALSGELPKQATPTLPQ